MEFDNASAVNYEAVQIISPWQLAGEMAARRKPHYRQQRAAAQALGDMAMVAYWDDKLGTTERLEQVIREYDRLLQPTPPIQLKPRTSQVSHRKQANAG